MMCIISTFKVECSLEFDAGSVRRKTLEILRNLIAKHDCDSRYADPVCVCVCACEPVLIWDGGGGGNAR